MKINIKNKTEVPKALKHQLLQQQQLIWCVVSVCKYKAAWCWKGHLSRTNWRSNKDNLLSIKKLKLRPKNPVLSWLLCSDGKMTAGAVKSSRHPGSVCNFFSCWTKQHVIFGRLSCRWNFVAMDLINTGSKTSLTEQHRARNQLLVWEAWVHSSFFYCTIRRERLLMKTRYKLLFTMYSQIILIGHKMCKISTNSSSM